MVDYKYVFFYETNYQKKVLIEIVDNKQEIFFFKIEKYPSNMKLSFKNFFLYDNLIFGDFRSSFLLALIFLSIFIKKNIYFSDDGNSSYISDKYKYKDKAFRDGGTSFFKRILIYLLRKKLKNIKRISKYPKFTKRYLPLAFEHSHSFKNKKIQARDIVFVSQIDSILGIDKRKLENKLSYIYEKSKNQYQSFYFSLHPKNNTNYSIPLNFKKIGPMENQNETDSYDLISITSSFCLPQKNQNKVFLLNLEDISLDVNTSKFKSQKIAQKVFMEIRKTYNQETIIL